MDVLYADAVSMPELDGHGRGLKEAIGKDATDVCCFPAIDSLALVCDSLTNTWSVQNVHLLLQKTLLLLATSTQAMALATSSA